MSALAKLLILAALAAIESQSHHPDAVEVFRCDFGRSWDVNYDDWPDKWQREFGPKLPQYVTIGIEHDAQASSGSCLAVRANGGSALVRSPCASVSDKFSYKVEARLRVTGVRYSRAQIRLEFCDEEKNVLQSAEGAWFRATEGWVDTHIGPINPTDPRISLARVALVVEQGSRADLSGEVALDEVWMGRLPKMTVKTNSAFNVYTDRDEIEVTCDLSGILDSDPDILFELLDASSQRLDGNRVQLEGRLIDVRRSKASEIIESDDSRRAAYAGVTSWRPPIRKHGFYRVRVTMETAEGLLKRDVINVAKAPPLTRTQTGEFGWSLAGDEIPISFEDLAQLLPRVAIHWVKVPVWYSQSEPSRGDDIVLLAEQLAAADIEMVGVLDGPPADSELAAKLRPGAAIVDTISLDPSTWMPLLDPVITRLSLRVRWWQFGSDYDASLSMMRNLEAELGKLREKLFRFGQEVHLGIGWTWNQTSAAERQATWEFQQYTATPALTGRELGAYLDLPKRGNISRWVLIEPLSRREYDLETRARDLVEQMLAGKIHGADAIFMARPFDDDRGLMTDRGEPGELLLPWRTTASLLSSAKYLGALQLSGRSHNRLFQTPQGEVVMVLWSDEPTRELVQLGEGVRILDVWGRQHIPEQRDGRQVLETAPLPRFIVGINPYVARWRIATKFATQHVPSVFGQTHANEIKITNTFHQGVGGVVELVGPEGWQISPAKIDFKLAAGETISRPFEIALPFDASSGASPIRADFVVEADRQYRFSVYRDLTVGDGEIQLETSTRLEADGSLVIEQRMTNNGGALVDFKCLLYAPGRRRQRTQVFRLGNNPDVKIYRYPDGAQLLGAELWLRAQEVDGARVLNHRFLVEQ
ncbi:MAG TPA: hypothetical protein VF175_09230 [Lacipirellula sp.]